jgi:hypothetical protein
LAIPQAAAHHPYCPLHDQLLDPPQEPAEYPEGEPAEQVLLDHPQEPGIGQGAFTLLHAVAVVLIQPSALLHPHVEFPPQEPAILDTEAPDVQAN